MKHLAVLLAAAALASPVSADQAKPPPTAEAPEAPKVAREKGSVKPAGGEKQQVSGPPRVNPPPRAGKGIVGPLDSAGGEKRLPAPSKEAKASKASVAKDPKAIVVPGLAPADAKK